MMSYYYIIIWFSQGFFAIPGCTSLFHFQAVYTVLLQELKVLYVQDTNLSGILSFKNEVTFKLSDNNGCMRSNRADNIRCWVMI